MADKKMKYTSDELQAIIDTLDTASLYFPEDEAEAKAIRSASHILVHLPDELDLDSLAAAQRERDELKDVLHTDRSGLAAALEEVRRTAAGYAWVAEGRGPYEWDDDEYRKEMGRMVREVCRITRTALEASGDLAHAECCGRGKR